MQRQLYLDELRAACMLLGVLVHAADLGNFGIFDSIPEISNLFRMATFFLISGYMAGVLMDRQATGDFLTGRMRNLVLPLVSCAVLVNPPTLWLIFAYFNADTYAGFGWREIYQATFDIIPSEGPMIWHLHLWFLFSLIFYALIAPLLRPLAMAIGRAPGVVRLATTIRGGRLAPLATVLATTLAILAIGCLWKVAGKLGFSAPWLLHATFDNLPFYATGLVLYHSAELWAAVKRFDPASLSLAAVILAVGGDHDVISTWEWVLKAASEAFLRGTIALALIAAFHHWCNGRSRILAELSRTIYTIYLFHYLIIYLIAIAYKAVLPLNAVGYLVIVALTVLASYLLHVIVIDRYPVLKLIFNGRKTTKSQPPATSAPT